MPSLSEIVDELNERQERYIRSQLVTSEGTTIKRPSGSFFGDEEPQVTTNNRPIGTATVKAEPFSRPTTTYTAPSGLSASSGSSSYGGSSQDVTRQMRSIFSSAYTTPGPEINREPEVRHVKTRTIRKRIEPTSKKRLPFFFTWLDPKKAEPTPEEIGEEAGEVIIEEVETVEVRQPNLLKQIFKKEWGTLLTMVISGLLSIVFKLALWFFTQRGEQVV